MTSSDDISSLDFSCVNKVQLIFNSLFKLKIVDSLKYFQGLEIIKFNMVVSLSQRKNILSLLDDTGFISSKLVTLPMDPNFKLSLNDSSLLRIILYLDD